MSTRVDPAGGDAVTPFLFEHAALRGAHVALPDTARAVLACHPYPPALARVLAEMLCACALLASTIRFKGSLVAQLSGDGPVRLLVVECTDDLRLRATAQWDQERTGALGADATLFDLAGGAAQGRLALTLDPQGAGTTVQGIVELASGSTAGLIEHYLATSEQLASRIVLATDAHGASGVLVQRLPGAAEADDEAWDRAQAALSAARLGAAERGAQAAKIIGGLFPEDDLRVFAGRPVSFSCACSRERVERALRIAGRAEVESIIAERGGVEVTCEFCNRRYAFAPGEARAALAPP